jgi:AraC-like DNA-binding protein
MPATPYDPLRWPPKVAMANFYPFRPGERVGPQWSASALVLAITQGVGAITIGGRPFAAEPGTMLYVPWTMPVLYVADQRQPMVAIGIHLAFAPWTAPEPGYPIHGHAAAGNLAQPREVAATPQPWHDAFQVRPAADSPLFDLAAAIAHAAEQAANQPAADAADHHALLRALALHLVVALRRERAGVERTQAHARAGLVQEMMSFLELNHARAITRAELATRAGVSESTLAAAFRAVTGSAPIDWLIDLRIARARRLLVSGHDPVGRIAAAVGIPDVFHFSKLFKRRVGMSPLKFRKTRRI